jgi:hypothetical protein
MLDKLSMFILILHIPFGFNLGRAVHGLQERLQLLPVLKRLVYAIDYSMHTQASIEKQQQMQPQMQRRQHLNESATHERVSGGNTAAAAAAPSSKRSIRRKQQQHLNSSNTSRNSSGSGGGGSSSSSSSSTSRRIPSLFDRGTDDAGRAGV